jgi:hypothetical protein
VLQNSTDKQLTPFLTQFIVVTPTKQGDMAMTKAFEVVETLANPTIGVGHSLKIARGFFETLFDQIRDGHSVSADDLETAEFALDEVAAKFAALSGAVETVTRDVAGLGRGNSA